MLDTVRPPQDRRQGQDRTGPQDPSRRPAHQASADYEASSISWNLTPGAASGAEALACLCTALLVRRQGPLAAEHGAPTVVGLQARQSPAIEFVQELLGAGYVGEVLSTTMVGLSVPGDVLGQPNAYMLDETTGASVLVAGAKGRNEIAELGVPSAVTQKWPALISAWK
jgi:hypothetical protein